MKTPQYPESCRSINCGNYGDACNGCDNLHALKHYKLFESAYMIYLDHCNSSGVHPMSHAAYAEYMTEDYYPGNRS